MCAGFSEEFELSFFFARPAGQVLNTCCQCIYLWVHVIPAADLRARAGRAGLAALAVRAAAAAAGRARPGVLFFFCCFWIIKPFRTFKPFRTVQGVCITPLYQQHASHTLASRAYGPRPHNPAELTSYRTIPRPSQLWWLAREASGCDGQHEHSEYTVVVDSRIRDSRDGQHEQRRCAVFNTLESDRRGQSKLESTELKWPFHLGISSLPRVAAAGVYCWF